MSMTDQRISKHELAMTVSVGQLDVSRELAPLEPIMSANEGNRVECAMPDKREQIEQLCKGLAPLAGEDKGPIPTRS